MREFILDQLSKLDSKYGLKCENNRAWIRCPFHSKNGHLERTPSLIINVDTDSRFQIGSFHCFGCNQTGSWNELADVLNLEHIEDDGSNIAIGSLSSKDRDELFKVESDSLQINSVDWDKNVDWRGISGKLVNAVGGLLTVDTYMTDTQLFLPCFMNKKYKGGINCRINREKWQKGYYNTPGEWASRALFPYDYTLKLINKYEKKGCPRVLFLVEGPRDALSGLQYGLPCMAILGTQNWSNYKRDLLLNMDLDLLVLALDNDEPGILGRDRIYKALKGDISMKKLTYKTGKDMADLKKKDVIKYKHKVGLCDLKSDIIEKKI